MKSLSTHIFRFGIATLLMASLLSFEFASASGPTCSVVFSEQSAIDGSIHDLAAMRISLDQAKAQGVSSIEMTALAADFHKKEQAIIEYLEINKIMTRQEFAEKLKQEIQTVQNENQSEQKKEILRRKEQEKKIKDNLVDGTRAIMHRVEPGSFKMGVPGNQVDVTLTKPFEMQAAPMTQIIWGAVANLAAQRLGYRINPDPSRFKGDKRPVEQVSANDVQKWINALNELSAMDVPALVKLIPGHKKGDVYRLPTEAEWEFVVRGRGQYNDIYHFGNDADQIEAYAWYRDNSDGETHPVALKKPLLVGGREFYDMHGNVLEWVQDGFSHILPGGVDPQGPGAIGLQITRGSSWNDSAQVSNSASRSGESPSAYGRSNIGFRLVRTVR